MFAKGFSESLPKRMDRLKDQGEANWEADKSILSPLSSFGAVLGTLRRRQGLDLETLAEQAGMEPDDVLAVELGIRPLRQLSADLPGLARALHIEPAVLAKFLVEMITEETALPSSDQFPSNYRDEGLND